MEIDPAKFLFIEVFLSQILRRIFASGTGGQKGECRPPMAEDQL